MFGAFYGSYTSLLSFALLLCCHVHERQGHCALGNGAALLQLVPSTPMRQQDASPRPSPDDVAERIRQGSIIIHPTRQPFTREAANSALVTVQKKLRLATGVNGQWCSEADEILKNTLESKKRKHRNINS